jgi:hypothetical protein
MSRTLIIVVASAMDSGFLTERFDQYDSNSFRAKDLEDN